MIFPIAAAGSIRRYVKMNKLENEFNEIKKQIKVKIDEVSKLLNEILPLARDKKDIDYYAISDEIENIGSSFDSIENLLDGKSSSWNNSGCAWESSGCYGE